MSIGEKLAMIFLVYYFSKLQHSIDSGFPFNPVRIFMPICLFFFEEPGSFADVWNSYLQSS